jgi:drug/metabolite transporter (DMT)-like permease
MSPEHAILSRSIFWLMPRHVRWHRVRVGLVIALIIIFAGVVIDSYFSDSWALDDGLLLAAAAVIALALLVTRGRGRSETR